MTDPFGSGYGTCDPRSPEWLGRGSTAVQWSARKTLEESPETQWLLKYVGTIGGPGPLAIAASATRQGRMAGLMSDALVIRWTNGAFTSGDVLIDLVQGTAGLMVTADSVEIGYLHGESGNPAPVDVGVAVAPRAALAANRAPRRTVYFTTHETDETIIEIPRYSQQLQFGLNAVAAVGLFCTIYDAAGTVLSGFQSDLVTNPVTLIELPNGAAQIGVPGTGNPIKGAAIFLLGL